MHNWKRISVRPDHWIPFKSWFSYLIQKYFLIVQYDIHNPLCVPACFSIDHDIKDINLTFSLYCQAFPFIICNISHKNGKTWNLSFALEEKLWPCNSWGHSLYSKYLDLGNTISFFLQFDMSRLSMDVLCFFRIFGNIFLRRSHAQCVFPKNLFHHRPGAKCKDCHDQAKVWRTLEQFSHACTNLDTCAQLFQNCIKLLYEHNTCTSFLVLVCKVMCSRLVIEASAAI